MFRTTLILIAVLSAAGTASAEPRPLSAATGQGTAGGSNEALEIMKDHMRSQLDWRSYFTNRMAARRRASAAEDWIHQGPRAASADPSARKAVDLAVEPPGRP